MFATDCPCRLKPFPRFLLACNCGVEFVSKQGDLDKHGKDIFLVILQKSSTARGFATVCKDHGADLLFAQVNSCY